MTTTLLAVDDSTTMRKVLEITFAGENYKTVLAQSADEALNAARSERPTIALLDHTLGDTNGYDLARELKSLVPGLAVMILSSKQNPFDKARAAASGVDDFMDKPFDTQKLLDKVAQVLAAPRAAAAPAAAPAPAPAPAP
ncbi:MAG TPA: response regulator, partial [Polyangiaceae bacterium]|nr:response regulator [Polyangiaceae bacterium]